MKKNSGSNSILGERLTQVLKDAGLTPKQAQAKQSRWLLSNVAGFGPVALKEFRQHYPAAPPGRVTTRSGGTLLTGGRPGNAGGGAKPSEIRRMLLDDFKETAPLLKEFANDKLLPPAERLRAVKEMGNFAIGPAKAGFTQEELEQLITRLAEATMAELHAQLRSHLSTDQFDELLTAIFARWQGVTEEID